MKSRECVKTLLTMRVGACAQERDAIDKAIRIIEKYKRIKNFINDPDDDGKEIKSIKDFGYNPYQE